MQNKRKSIRRPIKSFFSSDKSLFEAIKNVMGFYPNNIHLYKLAFKHKSGTTQDSKPALNNERLEYLGDAILGAIIADYLYKMYPYKSEGFLSEMRSKIVSRSQLNLVTMQIGLNKLIPSKNNTPSKSLYGDVFEAFVGAMYLDKGFEFTKKIIINNIIIKLFDLKELEKQNNNFKSQLLEHTQKNKQFTEFKVINELPANGHAKQYIVRVFIDGKPMETGCDYNIKGAEQAAAQKTLEIIHPSC
ncbi:ribonuclease III [Bacteroidales bacterium OttesenSCG-928-K03]|nr:ribonuclease III [Odoribacter sp. OttesenSCG-928-L07]MDL2242200.1 ribonuclease III [Bacteroidales bacterium OttesenSCG-928-K03]